MSSPQIKVPILDLKPQYNSIKTEIHAAIDRVLESGAFIMGPDVKLFEEEVAKYLGVKHAIGVNSGTDALVIGLRALGIGVGDEVLTTPFSFFATAESISAVGAKPVFVDIDAQTFNIDPAKIKEKITAKTKAIMPVHLYGQPAAMAQIMEIAQSHGLKVIEDCAQSFGARYMGNCIGCNESCSDELRASLKGKHTGTIGNVGAYSFFPSKNLGAYGDGGLIATNDDDVANMARMLRAHGARKKYHNEVLGYNSRLDTIQAAILRVKLPYIDKWNEGRRRVARNYWDLLANVAGVTAPRVLDGHVFHQYTIRIAEGKRDGLAAALNEQGIGTMIYYPIPQDRLPVYAGQYPMLMVSESLTGEVLSLPIWPELESDVQQRVVASIASSLT
jgi:dTDP-4-amino-4,6-dideoxygalactose transaminase